MQPRVYRKAMGSEELRSFQVRHRETDVWCAVDAERFHEGLPVTVLETIVSVRKELDAYIAGHPEFRTSLGPLDTLPGAPEISVKMALAARQAGVGPMAAVAGALSERVARGLAGSVEEVIVENGGDIFLISPKPRLIALYAGSSPLSGKVGLEVKAKNGLAVCSSSGTVGHALSFGKADCVTVVATSGALADAYATRFANEVKTQADIEKTLDLASRCLDVLGTVVVIGDGIGAWGDVVLKPIKISLSEEGS